MSIETDLSTSPYFDDYQESKDYYKILFQPSVPVQVRELNQLQTILQKQIEKFGDTILKRGTIISGCQFSFHTAIPYVKLRDTTTRNTAANVSAYEGLFVRNSANLVSRVIASNTGFEGQDPDLKTLYLEYVNNGDSGDVSKYANGQILTVYNNEYRIHNVTINGGSSGFSNSDSLVILSAIEVQNTTGGTQFANGGVFNSGDVITQDSTQARAEIISVNNTANTSAVVLRIKPIAGELAISNSDSWSFSTGFNIVSDGGVEGVVSGFIGEGATGSITTSGTGIVANVAVATQGSGYYVEPYATVSTTTASNTQINSLDLRADNFVANVVVATVRDSAGFAYGVSVSEGTIYQKEHFLRTNPQFMIIDKYANTPNAISVGFSTQESIVDTATDNSLFDNASGFLNENAPGANRLKLQPILDYKNDTEAENSPEFLPLVKFSEGRFYYQSTSPEFSELEEELARRTYEESGNYVLDQFNIATRSTLSIANSDTHFSYVIDPGHAYIDGYRVKTIANYAQNVEKATQVEEFSNTAFDLVYGNYVRTNEFAGLQDFSAGKQVSLRDNAIQYLSQHPGEDIANVVSSGSTEIGTARIRSVVYSGEGEGSPDGVYRIYLFDIRMNPGKNFRDVKSIYSDNASSVHGIADIILEPIAGSSGTEGAVLKETNRNSLVLNTEKPLKTAANVEYKFRTTDIVTVSTAGQLSVQAETDAVWPYSGQLTTFEERELIIIPEDNLIDTTVIATTNTYSSDRIEGGTGFITALDSGDYIYVADGANNAVLRVTSIQSDSVLDFAPADALSGLSGAITISRCYPKGIPAPLSRRVGSTAEVSGTALTVDLDITLASSSSATVVSTQRFTAAASTPVEKQAVRNLFVKIDTSTHAQGTNGPWCLGFPDIIRLRNVYQGTTTSSPNITDDFYVDANHNENYYDLGYLYLRPNSNLTLAANTQLLVEFDYTKCVGASAGAGVKTVSSYTINDEVPLANLSSTVSTLEIPEFVSKSGDYYDLRECFDFRPVTANTVAEATVANSAPVNPAEPTESTRFGSANNLLFPVPEGDMFCNLSYYKPRKDIIIVKSDGDFEILTGAERPEIKTPSQLNLYQSTIPAYPSLPENLSLQVQTILNTNMGGDTSVQRRRDRYTISTSPVDQQVRGYTMEEIAKLEKRISILEYYVNLSETEDEVKNKVIPSSVDSTLERFKFGFFVDNFVDTSFTDLDSRELSSTIYEGLLYPSRDQYNVSMDFDESSSGYITTYTAKLANNRKKLLGQPNVTDGPVIQPQPPTPEEPEEEPTVPETTVTLGSTSQFFSNHNTHITLTNKGKTYNQGSKRVFTLSSLPEANGTDVTIEFNVYGGKDRIEIYQSTNPDSFPESSLIYSSSDGTGIISNLTAARKRELNNLNLQVNIKTTYGVNFSNRWATDKDYQPSSFLGDNNYWMTGVGKITFPYDFSKGRYIRVVVVKGSPNYSYYITYPSDVIGSPQPEPVPEPVLPPEDNTLYDYSPVRPKPVITVDDGLRKPVREEPDVWRNPTEIPQEPLPTNKVEVKKPIKPLRSKLQRSYDKVTGQPAKNRMLRTIKYEYGDIP